MSLVDKVVYGKKSPVPDCKNLAYRKGKNSFLKQKVKFEHWPTLNTKRRAKMQDTT